MARKLREPPAPHQCVEKTVISIPLVLVSCVTIVLPTGGFLSMWVKQGEYDLTIDYGGMRIFSGSNANIVVCLI